MALFGGQAEAAAHQIQHKVRPRTKDPTARGKLDNSRSGKVNKAANKPRLVPDKTYKKQTRPQAAFHPKLVRSQR